MFQLRVVVPTDRVPLDVSERNPVRYINVDGSLTFNGNITNQKYDDPIRAKQMELLYWQNKKQLTLTYQLGLASGVSWDVLILGPLNPSFPKDNCGQLHIGALQQYVAELLEMIDFQIELRQEEYESIPAVRIKRERERSLEEGRRNQSNQKLTAETQGAPIGLTNRRMIDQDSPLHYMLPKISPERAIFAKLFPGLKSGMTGGIL